MIAMSVQNISMVLHALRKEADSGVVVESSHHVLTATEQVSELTLSLHQTFQQKNNRSSAFFLEETSAEVTFPQLLNSYVSEEITFVDFSCDAIKRFADAINKHALSCDGYVYFLHYQYVGNDFLMIGILETEESVSFSGEFDIQRVKYIDLNRMDMSARIDLTQYRIATDKKQYIAFIKGRSGRKISDFFMDFLNAEEGVDKKLQNETLIRAITSYADTNQVPMDQLLDAKKELQSYCREQLKAGDNLEVKRIGELLPEVESSDFYTFLTTDVGLPESFPPSQSALRTMTKYVGSGGGLNISFDQKLLGQRIAYDSATDTLTIVGIPPNLKDQLLRNNR
jgi:nucleoid-associated protein